MQPNYFSGRIPNLWGPLPGARPGRRPTGRPGGREGCGGSRCSAEYNSPTSSRARVQRSVGSIGTARGIFFPGVHLMDGWGLAKEILDVSTKVVTIAAAAFAS